MRAGVRAEARKQIAIALLAEELLGKKLTVGVGRDDERAATGQREGIQIGSSPGRKVAQKSSQGVP